MNTVVDLYSSGSSNYNHNARTNRFENGNYNIVGGYKSSLTASGWQGGKKIIIHINNTFTSTGASNQNDVALTVGDGWPANTTFSIDLGSSAVIAGRGGNGGSGGAPENNAGNDGGNGTSALGLESGMTYDAAAGAQIIEKHFTNNPKHRLSDNFFSVTSEQVKKIKFDLEHVYKVMNSPNFEKHDPEKYMRDFKKYS